MIFERRLNLDQTMNIKILTLENNENYNDIFKNFIPKERYEIFDFNDSYYIFEPPYAKKINEIQYKDEIIYQDNTQNINVIYLNDMYITEKSYFMTDMNKIQILIDNLKELGSKHFDEHDLYFYIKSLEYYVKNKDDFSFYTIKEGIDNIINRDIYANFKDIKYNFSKIKYDLFNYLDEINYFKLSNELIDINSNNLYLFEKKYIIDKNYEIDEYLNDYDFDR